jgi:hypothetical protein
MPAAKHNPIPPVAPTPATPFWQVLLAALVIVLSGLAAYSNSFHDDFVLDDLPAIKENPTIQNGWATPPPPTIRPEEILEKFYQKLPAPLQPPNDGQTVTGRPLVNVSKATMSLASPFICWRGWRYSAWCVARWSCPNRRNNSAVPHCQWH